MAYRSIRGNQFRKHFRKVRNPEHVALLTQECAIIKANPLEATEALSGNLAIPGVRYRRVQDTKPEYRIIVFIQACGFSQEVDGPTCKHVKCPVGGDEELSEEDDSADNDEGLEAAHVHPTDEPALSEGCEGLIKYAVFGTRELFNNLYKLRTKDFMKFL
ncbi:hypothetical protein [Hymenobacter sp. YC55]|uniref:hypothetical protein n=1 Tax=Hymenobacter sp. YC55 TaxID=3034019 RepID=UPI0023F8852A|nr:hypothetical protein [Hymenobacter sp. YC55]MDF7810946.1 hypothetical protein [Hymenobacter sp. YC55]